VLHFLPNYLLGQIGSQISCQDAASQQLRLLYFSFIIYLSKKLETRHNQILKIAHFLFSLVTPRRSYTCSNIESFLKDLIRAFSVLFVDHHDERIIFFYGAITICRAIKRFHKYSRGDFSLLFLLVFGQSFRLIGLQQLGPRFIVIVAAAHEASTQAVTRSHLIRGGPVLLFFILSSLRT
jgi:hypothetical protein